MGTVAERIAERGGMGGECVQVVDLEGKMSEIRADNDRTALVKFANFDQLLAAGGLEKDELGSATAGTSPHFLEAQNVLVERNGFFQIGDPVSGVEELGDHGGKA